MRHSASFSIATFLLNSAIVLVSSVASAQQTPSGADANSLSGKRWTLTEMEGRKFSAAEPYLEFDAAQTRVAGSGGCNRFGGTYEVEGSSLKFSKMISTRRACLDGEVQRVETTFLRLLQTSTRFEVKGNTLRFYAGSALALVLETGSAQGRVTGTVSYLQRIALKPNAVVEVKLVDVSRVDAPSITIAEQVIKPAGRQVPIAFEMRYDPSRIAERGRYAIQARILAGNKLLFINDGTYLVITGGNPNSVNVTVKAVR